MSDYLVPETSTTGTQTTSPIAPDGLGKPPVTPKVIKLGHLMVDVETLAQIYEILLNAKEESK